MSKSKNIRTVEEILNLETGEEIKASVLLDNIDDDDIILLRRKVRTVNREGKPIFVCAECGTKLELRCNGLSRKSRGKDFFFFKHYKDVKECSIKTDSHLPAGVLLARKYENVRESIPHIDLKNRLGHIIEQFHSPEKISIDNKFYFDKSGNGEKRKPDIYAVIDGREYAFEIQLNTTFLSVIEEREAFYEKNEVSILWIFKHFPLKDESQRLTQKDIYVPNRLNAFVLDDDMLNLSIIEKKLHLRVYYKTFFVDIDELEIYSQWNTKIITLENLNHADSYKPFYYDSFADKEKTKQELELQKLKYRLKQQRNQRNQQRKQELLAEQERIKQQKISRAKMLIYLLQSDIAYLKYQQSELLTKKEDLEFKIEKHKAENQEIYQEQSDINGIVEQTYNHLNVFRNHIWKNSLNPLTSICDISSIKDKYSNQIRDFEIAKFEIQAKLEKDVLPQNAFINEFPTCNIGEIEYSVIPPIRKYERFVEKFLKEMKMIETKDLETLFAASNLKDLPNISFFRWHIDNNNSSNTFLIDMSSRKSDTHFQKNILNNQLDIIYKDENTCKTDLKNDIIKLLNDKLSNNNTLISKCENKVNEILNKISDYSTRIDVLTKREDICREYMRKL